MVLRSSFIPESVGVVGVFSSLILCVRCPILVAILNTITNHVQYFIFSFARAIYNLTLHPLAKFPGPWLRGAFYFPLYWEIWTGDLTTNSQFLHDKYGDTVRTSPSSLSYNNAQAWQGLYGLLYHLNSC